MEFGINLEKKEKKKRKKKQFEIKHGFNSIAYQKLNELILLDATFESEKNLNKINTAKNSR